MADQDISTQDETKKAVDDNTKKSKMPMFVPIAAAVAVLGVGGYVVATRKPADSAGSAPSTSAAAYKDGTYTAEGTYSTHVGPKSINVKVTLKNNVITDADVTTPDGTDPMSVRYQQMFIENYKPLVIGKKITDIQLSKVSGSSLTGLGFNDALQKIETQAKTT